jgi:hypothetical protein
MECVFHGDSFHAASIKTTRNGLSFELEQAKAYKIDFLIYADSLSSTARHEPAHR